MESFVLYGLIIGLTSNLHCIGMCGPIAMAIPVNRKNNITILSGVLQYNLGRVLTYAILGVVVGCIGVTANTLGFLQWLSIITGVFLIGYAWRKIIGNRLTAQLPSLGLNSFVSKRIRKVLGSQTPLKFVLLGSLNGLLPCGMVYVGLMNALLTGSPQQSAFAMAAFGLGTLPAMIAVGFAANKVSLSLRSKMNRAVPYLLTLVGTLIILRGFNLDIPYISPKMKIVVSEQNGEKVEMSCCHVSKKCETK